MVKLIMAAHISGTRDGADWPLPGGEIDVPEAEAADMIRNQLARAALEVAVVIETAEPEEAAVIEEVTERATKRVTRAKVRRRK